jgi:hypothetical protein
VVSSVYSGFGHDITEILVKVALNTITLNQLKTTPLFEIKIYTVEYFFLLFTIAWFLKYANDFIW